MKAHQLFFGGLVRVSLLRNSQPPRLVNVYMEFVRVSNAAENRQFGLKTGFDVFGAQPCVFLSELPMMWRIGNSDRSPKTRLDMFRAQLIRRFSCRSWKLHQNRKLGQEHKTPMYLESRSLSLMQVARCRCPWPVRCAATRVTASTTACTAATAAAASSSAASEGGWSTPALVSGKFFFHPCYKIKNKWGTPAEEQGLVQFLWMVVTQNQGSLGSAHQFHFLRFL